MKEASHEKLVRIPWQLNTSVVVCLLADLCFERTAVYIFWFPVVHVRVTGMNLEVIFGELWETVDNFPPAALTGHCVREVFIQLSDDSSESSEVFDTACIIQATEELICIDPIQSLRSDALKVTANIEKVAPLLLKCGPRRPQFRESLLSIGHLVLDLCDQTWEIPTDKLEQYGAKAAA